MYELYFFPVNMARNYQSIQMIILGTVIPFRFNEYSSFRHLSLISHLFAVVYILRHVLMYELYVRRTLLIVKTSFTYFFNSSLLGARNGKFPSNEFTAKPIVTNSNGQSIWPMRISFSKTWNPTRKPSRTSKTKRKVTRKTKSKLRH